MQYIPGNTKRGPNTPLAQHQTNNGRTYRVCCMGCSLPVGEDDEIRARILVQVATYRRLRIG